MTQIVKRPFEEHLVQRDLPGLLMQRHPATRFGRQVAQYSTLLSRCSSKSSKASSGSAIRYRSRYICASSGSNVGRVFAKNRSTRASGSSDSPSGRDAPGPRPPKSDPVQASTARRRPSVPTSGRGECRVWPPTARGKAVRSPSRILRRSRRRRRHANVNDSAGMNSICNGSENWCQPTASSHVRFSGGSHPRRTTDCQRLRHRLYASCERPISC